jgi:hypothetical protein
VLKYLNPSFPGCFPDYLLMSSNRTKMDLQVQIYPNPVDQNLYIEHTSNKKLSIRIMDINGRQMIERQLNDIKTIVPFDVKPGVYHVLIANKAGQIILTKRIIKS